MSQFYRAIRIVLALLGFVLGLALSLALFFARRIITPPRERIWATPADLGLPFEEVQFPARDGLRLSGWFVPTAASGPAPVVILVHGWPWNRLGTAAATMLDDVSGCWPIDFLPLLHAWRHAGYHVFTFDLRNHGQSAAAPPVTFGKLEANDLLGALDYLAGRAEVDAQRLGAVGFSMGANAILYSLPRTQKIKAAVAVQPVAMARYSWRYGRDLMGPLAALVVPLTELFYRLAGGPALAALDPIYAASGAGKTAVLYVQGQGDRWGRSESVSQMAALTPGAAAPLLVEAQHHYDGYQYVLDHPELIVDFLNQKMG